MSHIHLPAATWLILAPAATLMLATDLRKGIASSRYRTVSRSEQPYQYNAITGLNMIVVVVAWYEVATVVSGWIR